MTVDQLKAKRKTKKIQFDTYVKRRDGVKSIISSIDNKLDDDISDINNRISSCASSLSDGLKIASSSKVSSVISILHSAKESYTGSDSTISSCRSNMESERSRCQRNINSLDYEIRQIENEIRAQGGTIYFWE